MTDKIRILNLMGKYYLEDEKGPICDFHDRDDAAEYAELFKAAGEIHKKKGQSQ